MEHNGKAFTYAFELDGEGTPPGIKRFPWLSSCDPSGDWEWTIRSVVTESLDEATAYMRKLRDKAGKRATGFRLYLRNHGVDWALLENRGSQLADFLERCSIWVWLMRARRLAPMESMTDSDCGRMKAEAVARLAKLGSAGDAAIQIAYTPSRDYFGVEIHGLTTHVDDLATLAKIITHALHSGYFGPWKHDENPLPNEGAGDAPASLRFVDHVERYLHEHEGVHLGPQERTVIDSLQHDYGTRATEPVGYCPYPTSRFATNVAIPLLPWKNETSFSGTVREALEAERENYLHQVRGLAQSVMDGDNGLDFTIASAKGFMRHLGATEAESKTIVEYRRFGGSLRDDGEVTQALVASGPESREIGGPGLLVASL